MHHHSGQFEFHPRPATRVLSNCRPVRGELQWSVEEMISSVGDLGKWRGFEHDVVVHEVDEDLAPFHVEWRGSVMNGARAERKESDPAGQSGDSGGVSKDAFDLWLKQGLHELFDSIASEPIPEELIRLIEEDRSK